ncbi:MAG TPA: glutamyl-tRNA reductase, partial [Chthonomonadales bacterium]|nr:glutamyl-tRNA reductase [Chthonomonadales bacterium]
MWIAVVGIDHTTAPIDLREQLACSPARALEVMSAARPIGLECVLLSTCNRIELYAAGSGRFEEEIETRLLQVLCVLGENRQVEIDEVRAHSYCFTGRTAVSHLFEVACGLQSLILGEPQIQGQVAEALEQARLAGSSGPVVSALFRAAIVAGKRARSETGISRSAVSVSHVAVQLARQLFPRLREATVLLIGSGRMSELAARNLRDNGAGRLTIINRTLEHAREFAARNGAAYRPIEELADALADADVVISSTHAPHALITVDMMQEALRQKWEREGEYQGDREGAQQLLIDIAIPRDIEPAVGALPGVYLYNLDDLQAGVSQGMEQRAREVEHVREIIAGEVGEFERWLRTRRAAGAISELRQHAEELRQQELERTLRQLAPTLSGHEIDAIQELSKSLVNKLLHTPTLRLKEAVSDGGGQAYAEAFHYIFDLDVQQ